MKIEEAKKCYYACVYCLEFPNGMKYVGKTKDLNKRMGLYLRFESTNKYLSEAIREFGWDSIEISVLSRVSCKDGVDLQLCLSILEIKYIRELCTLYPSGYNVSLGGECLGIPVEHLTTDKEVVKRFSDGSKCVLCYDLNGDFVKEYPSIANIAYDFGNSEEAIRHSIGKMKPFADKWFLRFKRYDYVPERIEVPVWEVRKRVKYKNVIQERIVEKEKVVTSYIHALKYDMNGDFCGEFKSKNDARRTYTKSNNVKWGEYCNGYILFKKVSDDYPKKIEDYTVLSKKQTKDYYVPANELEDIVIFKGDKKESGFRGSTFVPKCVDGKYTNIKHKFKVYQCDLSGNVLYVHDSIRDAADKSGISYSQIYNCLKGRTMKAAGFKWKKDGDAF